VHRFLLFLQLCVVKFGCQGVFLKQVFSWIIWEVINNHWIKNKEVIRLVNYQAGGSPL
jgi:hypothetical protein